MKVILLDYGRVVAPEDGIPVIQSVYGAPQNDVVAAELFRSSLHDLARGSIDESVIRHQLESKGYTIPSDYDERWEHTLSDHLSPDDGMIALIANLRKKYTVALLSNVWPNSARILRKNGHYDHFDKLFLSCEMSMAKPDQEIYDTVLKVLKVPASEILFVDDKEQNLTYLKGLGAQVLKVNNPKDAVTKITELVQRSS